MCKDASNGYTFRKYIKKKLSKFLGKIYLQIDFRFVFQPARRIENFFPSKDHAPSHICSSVVDKFMCSSCTAMYYSRTSGHLILRCKEHLGVNKKGKSIKGISLSIRDHIVSTDHSAVINYFYIISLLVMIYHMIHI